MMHRWLGRRQHCSCQGPWFLWCSSMTTDWRNYNIKWLFWASGTWFLLCICFHDLPEAAYVYTTFVHMYKWIGINVRASKRDAKNAGAMISRSSTYIHIMRTPAFNDCRLSWFANYAAKFNTCKCYWDKLGTQKIVGQPVQGIYA
jgi:hypothetical protein